MKKLILYASLVCIGMTYSCSKNELVPDDEKPEWLGSSIYEELQNPKYLSGTFNNYRRLVDDLGYTDVLLKTGSKTVFPANDEAFTRFFASNSWGVSSYEDLTDAMKKQLLYNSMLDNALLTEMLSNVPAAGNISVDKGKALKHETSIAVTDSVTTIYNPALMPQNNSYWNQYRDRSINVVYDATRPTLVHFTYEQMVNNGITVSGENSDFEIITGSKFEVNEDGSKPTFIFKNKVVKNNVTCQNGYIHQVENVIVPPGNMAQVLRSGSDTKLMSRLLDYHCAPYYDATTTNNYNDAALLMGKPMLDSIFQVRYFSSSRSQGGKELVIDPSKTPVPTTYQLEWDPGWNKYYPNGAGELEDMGAMLVPTDEAIKKFFLPGGGGSYFIDIYGDHSIENNEANLPVNLDSLFTYGNGIVKDFVTNLMLNSFVKYVPSKFSAITNKGSGDFMGMTTDYLARTADGKYDVRIANNGVIYMLNQIIAPDKYQSVIGPASTYPNMNVMKYFLDDYTTSSSTSKFGVDLYYYLMAMKANYAFMTPTNEGFSKSFIDAASLRSGGSPQALEFYSYVANEKTGAIGVKVRTHEYDPATGEVSPAILTDDPVATGTTVKFKSQVADMQNYCVVVLGTGEKFGDNHFYLTKHGGAVYVENAQVGGKIYGGAQMDNNIAPASIIQVFDDGLKNGVALSLDNVVQPSITSVHKATIEDNYDRFSHFEEITSIFDDPDLLDWAGISSEIKPGMSTSAQDRYIVFPTGGVKNWNTGEDGAIVNFFNGYNYTFFAPNNTAVEAAYALGLPTPQQIMDIYNEWKDSEETDLEVQKNQVLDMLNMLRAFVRYHFMNNSVFADNHVRKGTFQSLYSNELGIPCNITVSGGDGVLTVKDVAGNTVNINASSTTSLVNKMTRDYQFNGDEISLSSFAAVHEISTPLVHLNGRYDAQWASEAARRASAKNYHKKLEQINNLKD